DVTSSGLIAILATLSFARAYWSKAERAKAFWSGLRVSLPLRAAGQELLVEAAQLAGNAAVDHRVTQTQDHTADEIRVDFFCQLYRLAGAPAERFGETCPLVRREARGDGRRHR